MRKKQATEQTGQDSHRQEESWSTSDPALAIGGESSTGNDAMNMRMVEQVLPPGVEYGEESDFGTQVLGIGGDGAQRLGCGTEKDAVEDPFVVEGDGGDLFGQRENNMEIGGVQELGSALVDPPRARKRLTPTAVAVSTGVVPDALVVAVVTLLHMATESGSPACSDRVHDPALGAG